MRSYLLWHGAYPADSRDSAVGHRTKDLRRACCHHDSNRDAHNGNRGGELLARACALCIRGSKRVSMWTEPLIRTSDFPLAGRWAR
jgi:hypothetical protein